LPQHDYEEWLVPCHSLSPFYAEGQKVLEPTLREAFQLGHNHIGTAHLLLGLMKLGADPRRAERPDSPVRLVHPRRPVRGG
jgi:Clp amino terminal domain, pathogenicity island component